MNALCPLRKTSKPIRSVLSRVLARGCLSVCRPEKIRNAIPEQEFIGEYLLFAV